ncbi:MAG: DUF3240 family protein [Rugosibacter sp.]|jgi:hypothetical protein
MTRDICLHLVLPESLEEPIIDELLKHPLWVGPFLTHAINGHAAPEHIASEAERVRGRAHRVKIEILMAHDHARQLLAQLQADLPGADLSWWISPVLDSGALT